MKPNLFHISPLAIDMKLGRELNKHIECLPEDSWILVTDRDTMFLGDNYAKIIYEAIEDNPDAALMTCWTNRLKNKDMCLDGSISYDPDVINHYWKSEMLERCKEDEKFKKYTEIKRKVVAGMFWLFPRSTWETNKFDDMPVIKKGGKSFDIRWTEKINGKRIMINRLYIFHYYRMHKKLGDYDHLK